MPQELTYGFHINAHFKKPCSVTVPQGMKMDARNAQAFYDLFKAALHGTRVRSAHFYAENIAQVSFAIRLSLDLFLQPFQKESLLRARSCPLIR